ncbi:3044_t:CDS:2 [Funneliformis caledonium]|uniref:3044_t:CDS:1 n=1 Tax=Funneliformis caledonium TaxID=1117310 RepID=A0A9N9AXG6_9GLOM|nr:3044_t:CDS:2 [Funneliformis caledonium]
MLSYFNVAHKRRHYILRYAWQDHFSAPVNQHLISDANVLEIGCSVGSWILDMASEYPNSQYTGVDIISNFLSDIKPPNANFQIGIALHLPFENETFDFIHFGPDLSCLNLNVGNESFRILIFEITKRSRHPFPHSPQEELLVDDSFGGRLMKTSKNVMRTTLGRSYEIAAGVLVMDSTPPYYDYKNKAKDFARTLKDI